MVLYITSWVLPSRLASVTIRLARAARPPSGRHSQPAEALETITSSTSEIRSPTVLPPASGAVQRARRPVMPTNHCSAMLSYTPPSSSTIDGAAGGAPRVAGSKNARLAVSMRRAAKAPGRAADACTARASGTSAVWVDAPKA